jgi:ubiquinone biosynthesis protein UbiJ
MPAAQLVTSGIERVANQLLKLDPQSRNDLVPLAGKQFMVSIDEFPWPLVFAFSESIDVLAIEPEASSEVDCSIELSLATLKLLQDSSQITALIQQGQLKLHGDIAVAQQFSQLMKNISIDWEEQLSKYTGDVLAHTFFSVNSAIKDKFLRDMSLLGATLKDAAMEEKHIAAHPFAVEDFCQQVNELRGDTSRLEARLSLLEHQK